MDLNVYLFYEYTDDGWMNEQMSEGDVEKNSVLLSIKQSDFTMSYMLGLAVEILHL